MCPSDTSISPEISSIASAIARIATDAENWAITRMLSLPMKFEVVAAKYTNNTTATNAMLASRRRAITSLASSANDFARARRHLDRRPR